MFESMPSRAGFGTALAFACCLSACQSQENPSVYQTPPVAGQTAADASTAPPASPDTASASEPDPEPVVLQQRPDRVIVELPNRMILVAQAVPTAPVVSVQAWVKTGSLYEQEFAGAGLSHFLEHLISGGTTSRRPEAISTQTLGEIGAQTNAATSLDTVRYYINTTAPHTETAIDLLSDWMQNSLITDTEYQRERDVIQREFSMGQGDPNRIHWKLTQQARYASAPDHPGGHPTIGYLDEFLQVSRDQIYDFYKRMYVPNNMVFVVVGDIDPAAVTRQLENLWQDLPTGDLPTVEFPTLDREAQPVEVLGVASVSRPRVRLLWPGVELASEYDYALDLLAGVLGGGESSRLVRDLRDNRQLVTSIDAFNYSAHWGEGFFGVDYELTEPGAADAVRTAVIGQLETLRNDLVKPEELARVKRQTLARVLKSGQSADGLANTLASNIIATADPDYLPHYAAAIQEVSAEQLRAAARTLLDPQRASVARLDPAQDDQSIEYQSRLAESRVPTPGPRTAVDLDNYSLLSRLRSTLQDADASTKGIAVEAPIVRTLDNGLTVIAQRSTVVPAVAMQLYTKGGLLADEPGREGVSHATYAMLMRGTQQRSAAELAAAVEDLGAGLDTGSGNNTGFVRASALTEDWPAVMALMSEVVLQPAFDPEEWNRLRPRLVASIQRATDTWPGELRSVFRRAYYDQHPWSQLTEGREEVVQSLTPEDLGAFHDARINAAESVLAVVGDIEPDAVFAEARRLFGEMPGRDSDTLELPQPADPTPGLTIQQTPKPVAAVQVGYGPGITRDSPDYAAIQVLSRVIGDFPAGWLQQELRGRGPGLVYASSAGANVGLVPGYFAMLFNTQPDTVDEALERTVGVAQRAKTQLIDQATLDRAKAKVLTNEFFGRQSNGDLATGQALDLLYGIDDLDSSQFLDKVEALTAQDIQDVARRYLNDPVVVIITHEPLDEPQLQEILK